MLLIPALISCNSTDRLAAHVPDRSPVAIRIKGDQLLAATVFGGNYLEEDSIDKAQMPLSSSDTFNSSRSKNQPFLTASELTASGMDLMGHAWAFMLPEAKHWALLIGLKDSKALEQLLAQKKCNKRQTKDPKIKVAEWPIAGLLLVWDDEKFLLVNDTSYSTDGLLKLMNTQYPPQTDDWKSEILKSKSAVDLYASSAFLKEQWKELPMLDNGFAHAQFSLNDAVEAEIKLFGTRNLASRILGGVQEEETEQVWHEPVAAKKQAFSLALRLSPDTLLRSSAQSGWFQSLLSKIAFLGEVINPVLKDWNGQLVYERLINLPEEPEKWQVRIGIKQKENAQLLLQKLYSDGWLQQHSPQSYQLAGLYKLELEKNQLCWTAPLALQSSAIERQEAVDNACVAYVFIRPGWFSQSTWNLYNEPLPNWIYSLSWLELQMLAQAKDQPYSKIKLRCMPSKKWLESALRDFGSSQQSENQVY